MRLDDEITTHPLHRENLETVQGLIVALRESRTLRDLSSVQECLFEAIQNAENEQQRAEDLAQRCARSRDEVLRIKREHGSLDKVKLWELQQEEKNYNLRATVLKHVRLQLRSVGDGLLWKAVDYDRGYIGTLTAAPGSGNLHLADGEGLGQERRVIAQCHSKGILAVHHDLTACARVGDLTLVYPSGKKTTVEVKKTKASGSKQELRLRRISQILSGAPVNPSGEPTQILRSIPGTPKHHLDKYCEILVEAGMKGHASKIINDYMGITAVNFLHSGWDTIHDAPMSDQRRAKLYKQVMQADLDALRGIIYKEDSTVGKWDSEERIYVEEARSGAPWSIYPFTPDVCAFLTCGYLRFWVHFNQEAFFKRFKFAGFNAEVVGNETVKRDTPTGNRQFFPVIKVSRTKLLKDGTYGSRFALLGRPNLQQVLFEGIHFDTLLESMKPIFRGPLPSEGDSLVFNHLRYVEDASIWNSLYLHPAQVGSGGEPLFKSVRQEATIIDL